MSKSKKKEMTIPKITYSLEQITKLILKNENINQGFYLGIIMPEISGGQIKSSADENLTQGLVIEFKDIKLIEVDENTENAIDASSL